MKMKKNINQIFFTMVLLIMIATTASATQLSPVTKQCVLYASEYYDVPFAALIGIMVAEGGKVGKYSTNKNGTRDNGPMQINTVWLKELSKHNYTESMIRNNGCVNIFVGAWILKGHLTKTKSQWKAIGNYHSKTKKHNEKYQWLVYKRIKQIKDYNTVIEAANSSIKYMGE